MKCLYHFTNLEIFNNFIYKHELNEWKIIDDIQSLRADKIRNYNIYKLLRNRFKTKQLYKNGYKGKKNEVITWLDTLKIIWEFINHRDLSDNIRKNIEVYMEYVIPDDSFNRPDYIIEYEDKLIIIEFYNLRRKDYNSHSLGYYLNINKENKYSQLSRYKERLEALQFKKIDIFPFIYLPEYTPSQKIIENNILINKQILYDLVRFVNNMFVKKEERDLENANDYFKYRTVGDSKKQCIICSDAISNELYVCPDCGKLRNKIEIEGYGKRSYEEINRNYYGLKRILYRCDRDSLRIQLIRLIKIAKEQEIYYDDFSLRNRLIDDINNLKEWKNG